MTYKKRTKKIEFGPVITIIILTFIIMLISFLFTTFEIQGNKTQIVNGSLETSLTTANNMFTGAGIKYIFNNVLVNFNLFEPLIVLIIVLIGISIGEASGLFKFAFSPFKNLKSKTLTLLTLFIGIFSTFIGDYSYMLLLPLIGIIYKYAGRNSMLGIITVFIGMTIGYGTGLIYNYDSISLGMLTEAAAIVDVDKTYQFNNLSVIYIMLASTIILSYIGMIIIENFLKPKIKKSIKEEDNYIESKKAFSITTLVFIGLILIIGYMITPGLPFSGILLDNNADRYMVKLFGSLSPFRDGIILIITLILMICGFVYGYLSGNIKNSNDYSVGLSKSFNGLGYVFVLMFFVATMIGILDYTNIGEVITAKFVEMISLVQLTGLPLIITFFLFVIITSILMPSSAGKWVLMSPLVVPLFMRSNITPDFTQFIFSAADGVGKCVTPMFIYLIIMIAFLERYNGENENKVTIFGTLKLIMPTVLLFTALWILIIVGWYIINLPLGIGTFPTL